MIAVQLELLVDRYHATAWDRAANEGEPEWPPAPWRLGRALVSTWWQLPPDDRPDEGDVDDLLQALSGSPRFAVPRATFAHTRHYMPRPDNRPVLVLDPFVRTDGSPILMVWDDVTLDAEQVTALDLLLSGIGYIGRAESPCIARRTAAFEETGLWIEPLGSTVVSDANVIRVLCLADDTSTSELSQSTAERRRRRVVAPACGRWVSYTRPKRALRPRTRWPSVRPAEKLLGVRFSIEGAAVPPVTEALRLAERYRAAVLKRADSLEPDAVARLRGRHEESTPLEGHIHAHFLATDEDGDRRLDHLTVWCPAGLGDAELGALDVTTLRSWAFEHPIRLVLLDTLRPGVPAMTGPLSVGRVWRSHTPFLPPRHPKRRSGTLRDTWDEQVRLELARRGLPSPRELRPLRAGQVPWGAFRRERGPLEQRSGLPALGFELEFEKPVHGPIALGRNSHFGMGLFLPVDVGPSR